MDCLYMDHHSATQVLPESLESYVRGTKEYFARSTALHFLGSQQSYSLQKSIESAALELGLSDEDEIFFTSSGQAALLEVFWSAYLIQGKELGKTHILIPETEELSFHLLCNRFEKLGCSFKFIPVNSKGQVTKEALEKCITPRTALVSLSWANGLTSTFHPIADLAEVCKEKGALFHVDASYAYGKTFFRFQDLEVDYLTLDGSSLHSAAPLGLCVVRPGLMEERLMDVSPIESTAAVASFVFCLQHLQEKFESYCMEVGRLRDRFEQRIIDRCEGVRSLFQKADRLPSCSVLSFPSMCAESLLFLLNSKGLYANLGGDKFLMLSDALLSCGVDLKHARGSLLFTFSYRIQEKDIDAAVEIITECFFQLKKCLGDL